ncbi:MAG TPA: hypothetical protein VGU01_13740 [Sphingomicrobium sp.]|nr:hypothetical protein [Sphingomicrobium sp.]
MRTISLREAITDPNLLGNVIAGKSYALWRKALLAVRGELTLEEWMELRDKTGGRESPPPAAVMEALFVIGRRGGKDRAISVLAVYLAALVDYSHVLSPGERGVVLVIAPDQRQAQIQLSYVRGVLESSPVLSKEIVNQTADTVELRNGIVIEVRAANFRRLRGITAVAVIASEAAFFYTEDTSENGDTAILNSVRPSLATTNGPLIIITSPYAPQGEVYEIFRRHFGPDGDPSILVVQGASRDFNPTLPQSLVDRALERDPAAAKAEFLGEFRSDVSALLTREAVDGVTIPGRFELPPAPGISYSAFVDPSGGSADSMTLAIAHKQGQIAILDAVRECKPPFSPEAVVQEFAELLKRYGIRRVRGDRYAGLWPRERFQVHGITYETSDKSASDLYREFLPIVNGNQAELLDLKRLFNQLVSLERRVSRSGKDNISHPPQGHDDVANSVAGALVGVTAPASVLRVNHQFWGDILNNENSDAHHDMMLRSGGLKGQQLRWHQRRPIKSQSQTRSH